MIIRTPLQRLWRLSCSVAIVTLLSIACALMLLPTGSVAQPTKPNQDPDFQVPPGFIVEKVAGPPLVRYPLFACFDDRGRLFVAEGTGTNLAGEELAKQKLGRILLLEDTDGDGKFDKSTVFADGLVFPQGVLWHDGALYTMSHPSMWKLEDPEGKGVATKRTEMVTKFNFNGNGLRHSRPIPWPGRPTLLDRRQARLQGEDPRGGAARRPGVAHLALPTRWQ